MCAWAGEVGEQSPCDPWQARVPRTPRPRPDPPPGSLPAWLPQVRGGHSHPPGLLQPQAVAHSQGLHCACVPHRRACGGGREGSRLWAEACCSTCTRAITPPRPTSTPAPPAHRSARAQMAPTLQSLLGVPRRNRYPHAGVDYSSLVMNPSFARPVQGAPCLLRLLCRHMRAATASARGCCASPSARPCALPHMPHVPPPQTTESRLCDVHLRRLPVGPEQPAIPAWPRLHPRHPRGRVEDCHVLLARWLQGCLHLGRVGAWAEMGAVAGRRRRHVR